MAVTSAGSIVGIVILSLLCFLNVQPTALRGILDVRKSLLPDKVHQLKE